MEYSEIPRILTSTNGEGFGQLSSQDSSHQIVFTDVSGIDLQIPQLAPQISKEHLYFENLRLRTDFESYRTKTEHRIKDLDMRLLTQQSMISSLV